MNDDFPVVFSYSRSQALADGVLVDAGTMAQEARLRAPVALTASVWADCVEWGEDDGVRGAEGQSTTGRLWDVVYMAAHAARLHKHSGRDRLTFSVMRVPRKSRRMERVELVLHIGGGDEGEPVATILQVGES